MLQHSTQEVQQYKSSPLEVSQPWKPYLQENSLGSFVRRWVRPTAMGSQTWRGKQLVAVLIILHSTPDCRADACY
eukprot:13839-Amphidinium_carterae.1